MRYSKWVAYSIQKTRIKCPQFEQYGTQPQRPTCVTMVSIIKHSLFRLWWYTARRLVGKAMRGQQRNSMFVEEKNRRSCANYKKLKGLGGTKTVGIAIQGALKIQFKITLERHTCMEWVHTKIKHTDFDAYTAEERVENLSRTTKTGICEQHTT